jgi:hypothetical protein
VIVLGILAGALLGVSTFFWWITETCALVNKALEVSGSVLGFLIFPALGSFISRRYYLWWGSVIPVLTYLVALTIESFSFSGDMITMRLTKVDFVDYMGPSGLPYDIVTDMVAGTLMSSGSVSLIRWLIARRRKPQMDDTPSKADLYIAGSDSAWPPAPRKERK